MSSQKRKRSASVFSITSRASSAHHHLPRDAINPLSHSDGTIKQLRVAGLTENDLLPSTYTADFPHRALLPTTRQQQQRGRSGHAGIEDSDGSPSSSDDHGDDDDDGVTTSRRSSSRKSGAGGEKARRARRMRDAQDAHLGVLTGVVLLALAEGDVPRARRAFGLLRRSEVRGKPVDLRRNGLWALGAEVLMREGEERRRRSRSRTARSGDDRDDADADDDDNDDDHHHLGEQGGGAQHQQQGDDDDAGERWRREKEGVQRRWGSAANMPRLRAYLEGLIRMYPYNRLHPGSTSDLDFYPVLFGSELYDAWSEHRRALDALEERSDDDDEDVDDDDPYALEMTDEHHHGGGGDDDGDDYAAGVRPTRRERRLREDKAALGLRAMGVVRDVVARMDALLENAPYSRSAEMLRLRGMAALYLGDLSMPPPPRTKDEEEEGRGVRRGERERARTFFAKMRENGGRADALVERWLNGDGAGDDDDYGADEDEDMQSTWSGLPVFSSLPMR